MTPAFRKIGPNPLAMSGSDVQSADLDANILFE
jgi:hypothetical protein